jgi:hypothetical protein
VYIQRQHNPVARIPLLETRFEQKDTFGLPFSVEGIPSSGTGLSGRARFLPASRT